MVVGNEEDLQLGLGVPGADVEKESKLDPAAFFGMIDNVKAKFPNVKVIATTLREVHTTNRHTWSAVCWIQRSCVQQHSSFNARALMSGKFESIYVFVCTLSSPNPKPP